MNIFLENILKTPMGKQFKNPDSTDSKTKETTPLVLGKIYAEWCGHCKILEPKWAIISKELPKRFPKKSPPFVYEVEETYMDDKNRGLGSLKPYLADQRETVELQGGYPTIFKIVHGKLSYYDGPREVGPIIKWATQGIHLKKQSNKTNKRFHKNKRSKYTRKSDILKLKNTHKD